MTSHKINATGLAEIREYLTEHCNFPVTENTVQAWASELATALDEGKFEIEVAARYSNSGRPQFLSVAPNGVDEVEESGCPLVGG